jgi:hypothetical protein
MRLARNLFQGLFWVFFVICIGGGLFWVNLNFARQVPGGTDFISPWRGIQNFAMSEASPYGEGTALDLQMVIYGRLAQPGEYPHRVDWPFHLLIFLLPFASLHDLTLARALWMLVLEAALLTTAFLTFSATRWRLRWPFLALALLFSIFWMPAAISLLDGNAIILQTLCVVGAIRALEQQADELAGALLILALLNLPATGMAVLLVVIWAFSAQRWRLLAGLAMSFVVLYGLSIVLFPSWILPFLRSVLINWRAEALPSTFALFESWFPGIGSRLAQILAVAVLAVIFWEWSAVRGKEVRWLFWTVSLTAALSPLLGVQFMPAWLFFTLPGLLLAVLTMGQRWGVFGLVSGGLVLTVFFLGLWAARMQNLTAIFLLVYPLGLVLVLYWVRWAVIRSPRLWADEISSRS